MLDIDFESYKTRECWLIFLLAPFRLTVWYDACQGEGLSFPMKKMPTDEKAFADFLGTLSPEFSILKHGTTFVWRDFLKVHYTPAAYAAKDYIQQELDKYVENCQ